MPCQSLFFALITYRMIVDESICNVHKNQRISLELKNFELVHLSNIREFGGSDLDGDIEPWVENLS